MASPLETATDRMSNLRDLSIALNIVLGQGEPGDVRYSASALSRVIEELADQVIGLLATELDRQNPRLCGCKGVTEG